ncbi:MAG: rRNA maturation RNase YbeY [Candidatus Moranbacteria bacterium]|nr:rRNA maturation RNase YbeY [Candidatus Moranbacteria bacterium]
MKLSLEINNQTKAPVRKPFVEKAMLYALDFSGFDFSKKKDISISFAWVSEEQIRRLNRDYRKKDSITDILSFPELNSKKEIDGVSGDMFLGELILCYNYIKEYAEKGKSKDAVGRELAGVIAHGVLHLLGFRHGAKMFGVQKEVVQAIYKDKN